MYIYYETSIIVNLIWSYDYKIFIICVWKMSYLPYDICIISTYCPIGQKETTHFCLFNFMADTMNTVYYHVNNKNDDSIHNGMHVSHAKLNKYSYISDIINVWGSRHVTYI